MKSTVKAWTARRSAVAAVTGGLLLAGCASSPPGRPAPPAPEPALLSAGTLALPRDCRPAPGAVYRTNFVVQPDGRVASITSESGSDCAHAALRDWVSTFRYGPVPEATASTLDWVLVSAARAP